MAADESGNLTFTAVLDNAVAGGFDVDVSFTDGTATGGAVLGAGVDYVDTTQTLTFAGSAGETVMFTVAVNDDAVLEADEDLAEHRGPRRSGSLELEDSRGRDRRGFSVLHQSRWIDDRCTGRHHRDN